MMNKKLIAETGKCKLKGFDYPVRIYATDGGLYGTFVHGAYKLGSAGWHTLAWNSQGEIMDGVDDSISKQNVYDLVPIPTVWFFSVYTDEFGNKFTGSMYQTREEAKAFLDVTAELFKYDDGIIRQSGTIL